MKSDFDELDFDDDLDPEGPSAEDLDRFGDEYTTCARCGEAFYDQSAICPRCGHPVRDADKAMPRWVLITFVLAVILVLVGLIL